MENGVDQQTVYAEVLYTFKAVGAEELSLERGALVEVLRMESGPWWLGRIKHDAILLSEKNELRQGWFPRDFVKVNQNKFYTDTLNRHEFCYSSDRDLAANSQLTCIIVNCIFIINIIAKSIQSRNIALFTGHRSISTSKQTWKWPAE